MRVVATLLLALAGCVFRNPEPPRFFRPESATINAARNDGAAPAAGPAVPVRLRPVHATRFLRERIVWRVSDVEYGQYEQRRWSELPARYVERALAGALGETPGLRLTDDPNAPTLRVEVVAFDEVLASTHHATVALAVSLRDGERRGLLDRSFSAEAPIEGKDPSAVAYAMGHALDLAVEEVATAVAAALHPVRRGQPAVSGGHPAGGGTARGRE